MERSGLVNVWAALNQRNLELGLSRFDYGDVNSSMLMLTLSRSKYTKVLYKLFKIPEFLFPVLWRKLLGIPKSIVPSVYYHLGQTYLEGEKIIPGVAKDAADFICNDAINAGIKGSMYLCWEHPYKHHAGEWKDDIEIPVLPLSCAHHTARIGIMLLNVGKAHSNEDYIRYGVSSANALLNYHNWSFYDNGSCGVSYYPHTNDEVINTGADTALLLAKLPECNQTSEIKDKLTGLIKMICSEQNIDGSWFYCTQNHYKRNGGIMYIDNHHTSMNIAALAQIIRLKVLDNDSVIMAKQSLNIGVRYFLDNLVSEHGDCYYFPGGSKRDAGSVGYSEAISALVHTLSIEKYFVALPRERIKKLLPKLIDKLIEKYVDHNTGDVACYVNYGRKYNISSARWGSLPLMQSISEYLNYIDSTNE
jgi:hypothetical protein